MAVQKHVVQDGEDGGSIAARYGFPDSSAIWALADNAKLREVRPNENQLFPGDLVFIPEREEKYLPLKEKAQTKFTLTVPKQRVRLVVTDATGAKVSGRAFRVYDDDDAVVAEGTTGGDGAIACDVPARTRSLRVEVSGLGTKVMKIGGINPLRGAPDNGASGCAQRLAALGYAVGSRDGRDRTTLEAAIKKFKTTEGVAQPEVPELDEALFAALEAKYGQ